MRAFSTLLEALIFSPRRSVKQAHLVSWFKQTPVLDRGWGLAALTGDLSFPHVKAGVVRQLATQVTDPELFALSYDFVGDLAETVALLWPQTEQANTDIPPLVDIVEGLMATKRGDAVTLLSGWMDIMTTSERWALLKLATGGMRVGVSARMVRLALSAAYKVDVAEIEEMWPLLSPPYDELFGWLEGVAPRPQSEGRAVFRPLMLAHPLEDEISSLQLDDWQIEWKWDGARVLLASADDGVRLFSRTGDDISAAFPDLTRSMTWQGVLDGELLAGAPDNLASFNMLQQRLNRKTASAKLQAKTPVFLRIYDMLFDGTHDMREQPLHMRRRQLEQRLPDIDHPFCDLSPALSVLTHQQLGGMREQCRSGGLIEGMMLKRNDSFYRAGRIKGDWFKWKRDPLTADLVVLYAQRGHGKRSSYYSDYTFGAWREGEDGMELVPVGKAYSGFSDQELVKLDKFVRENTAKKFGPVREVDPHLVVEVAFDSIHTSSRHKSGVAMRFPRFHAIRWDKHSDEADTVAMLQTMIEG
ncbi:cisplatin damage response ATP-dependent DNA ligase [Alphaproteobacteria bacterium]|nr:cisplatin damage response ATP-dependent DNA ligase [Alphaproteobacteria bacterium]